MTDFSASVDGAEDGFEAVIGGADNQAAVAADGRQAFIDGDGRTATVSEGTNSRHGAFSSAFSSAFNL